MQNMRAYKDGRRLVIVLEDAGAEMEDYIKDILTTELSKVEHLAPPPQMAKPKVDTGRMQEITPGHTIPQRNVEQRAETALLKSNAPVTTEAGTAGRPEETQTNRMGHRQPEIPKKSLPKFIQNTRQDEGVPASALKESASLAPVAKDKTQEIGTAGSALSQSRQSQRIGKMQHEMTAESNQESGNQEKPAAGIQHGIFDIETETRPIPPGNKDAQTSKTSSTDTARGNSSNSPTITPGESHTQDTKPVGALDISAMNVFELKDFLTEKRENPVMKRLLEDRRIGLDWFLAVKSGREIRELALQFAGM